ncbi:MAG: hypothetical protein KHY79_07110 [Clostridiales bacterium]|nr:hypothetical protein [Clostridiales bacterium]
MKNNLNLIVMLTHNDKTVHNAAEIFEQCRNSKAKFWGMKESPLPFQEMKKLFDGMKNCGKITVLETVAYTEAECMKGAETAAACGCDILMGTKFFESVNALCHEKRIKYMPFVGAVSGRPSILEGSVDSLIEEAKYCIKKGAYGIDLLGYRYTGNADELNRRFLSEIDAPVCIAGSINSFERLDELKNVKPWGFTIGGAFFEKKFGDTFARQIDSVCDYIESVGERDV